MTGRIMAIDYGSKRVGIAMSDPMCIFAKAHSVLQNTSFEELLSQIEGLISDNKVAKVLVGMPYGIDGSFTPKTIETDEFRKKLQESLSVPVISFDERYSSAEAEDELRKMGKTWQEARLMVDAMAAAMILKSYLSSKDNEQS